jgi:hypothetical protein
METGNIGRGKLDCRTTNWDSLSEDQNNPFFISNMHTFVVKAS